MPTTSSVRHYGNHQLARDLDADNGEALEKKLSQPCSCGHPWQEHGRFGTGRCNGQVTEGVAPGNRIGVGPCVCSGYRKAVE